MPRELRLSVGKVAWRTFAACAVASASWTSLCAWQAFTASPLQRHRAPRHSSVQRAAAGAAPEARPALPTSAGMMLRQAVDAVSAAYADGVSRQWVRLRLHALFDWDETKRGGMWAIHKASLPIAQKFVSGLQSSSKLVKLRTSLLDEPGAVDCGTLLYREMEDRTQDAAVFFLVGRLFVFEDQTDAFLDEMKDRLVIMLNTEDAASTFSVDSAGGDAFWGGITRDIPRLKQFCAMFKEETYHYSTTVINRQTYALFRVYPHPWEVYIEVGDGKLEKMCEMPVRPRGEATWDKIISDYKESNT